MPIRKKSGILSYAPRKYKGSRNYIKKSKERRIATASKSSDNVRTEKPQKLGTRNGKKDNCMDISSDKRPRLHSRKSGHGYKTDKSREKLNFQIAAQINVIRNNNINR